METLTDANAYGSELAEDDRDESETGLEEAEERQAIVRNSVTAAIAYVDNELMPERITATNYYKGLSFGDEVQGRSKVVMTEVRDGITGILPSLLRVLHGPEHTVEYIPREAQGVDQAAQATDYARYVYEEDNKGFSVTHSVLKDGLLKKLGVIKWGIDEAPRRVSRLYRGLTREQLMVLAQDGRVELTKAGPSESQTGLFDAEIREEVPAGRIWVQSIPTDDFFWNREARSIDDAVLVGHRDRLTRSELLAMGVKKEDIDAYGTGTGAIVAPTLEEQARRQPAFTGINVDQGLGKGNQRALFCEIYIVIDGELRRIWTLGVGYQIIRDVPAESKPFAMFSPDPEPHAMLGGSWYDRLKDMQRINSQLARGLLDSLSTSLFPRTAYVDGQVSVQDILNTALGAPIRMRQPGMVQTFEVPFAGDKVIPVMQMIRETVERRIGNKDGAGSLDMDALQSTEKEAAKTAIDASQAQAELLCRMFAEQVMKPMYRGLLKLIANPQSQARIIRLRGSFVPVNPCAWDANMDVAVNIALGSMNTDKKVAVLMQVAADQTDILKTLGPDNPVVSLGMLRNTKAKILALQGVMDVDNYYKPIDPNAPPPPPPPPEPSEDDKWRATEAQMNQEKIMKELAIKQDELAMKREEFAANLSIRQRELDIREEELRQSAMGSPAEVAKAALDQQRLDLERDRMLLDAEVRKYVADVQAGATLKSAEISAEAQADAAESAKDIEKEVHEKD